MDQEAFEREMMRAKSMEKHGGYPDYWQGYQRGLNRLFHGIGTDAEHEFWMSLTDDSNHYRAERGRGYRDALKVT